MCTEEVTSLDETVLNKHQRKQDLGKKKHCPSKCNKKCKGDISPLHVHYKAYR